MFWLNLWDLGQTWPRCCWLLECAGQRNLPQMRLGMQDRGPQVVRSISIYLNIRECWWWSYIYDIDCYLLPTTLLREPESCLQFFSRILHVHMLPKTLVFYTRSLGGGFNATVIQGSRCQIKAKTTSWKYPQDSSNRKHHKLPKDISMFHICRRPQHHGKHDRDVGVPWCKRSLGPSYDDFKGTSRRLNGDYLRKSPTFNNASTISGERWIVWKYSEKDWGHGFSFSTGLFSRSLVSPHLKTQARPLARVCPKAVGSMGEDRRVWMPQKSFWEPIASSLRVDDFHNFFYSIAGGYVAVSLGD